MIHLPEDAFESIMMEMNYSDIIHYCDSHSNIGKLCSSREFFIKYIWKKVGFEFNMDNMNLRDIKGIASLTDIVDISIYDEGHLMSMYGLKRFFKEQSLFQRDVIRSMLKSGIYPIDESYEIENEISIYDGADPETVTDIVDEIYDRLYHSNVLENYIRDIFSFYSNTEETMDIYEYLRSEESIVFDGLVDFVVNLLKYFGNDSDEIFGEEFIVQLLKDYRNATWSILERSLIRDVEVADFVEILNLHVDILGGIDVYRDMDNQERYLFNDNMNRLFFKFEDIMDEDDYDEQHKLYIERFREISHG